MRVGARGYRGIPLFYTLDSEHHPRRQCTLECLIRAICATPPVSGSSFGAEAAAPISSLLSSTAGRGRVRWPRAGASYLMWARRPWVFYIKTSVKSQTFRNYLLPNFVKFSKSRQESARPPIQHPQPQPLQSTPSLRQSTPSLRQDPPGTRHMDARAAPARCEHHSTRCVINATLALVSSSFSPADSICLTPTFVLRS